MSYLRHTDWLGSSRFATTWNHAVCSKTSYAPFGETYNEPGTADRSFTGQDQDVITGSGATGVYDFLYRKHDPSAGRWLSPDPSGWAAVDFTNPQTLNRYAYVLNNPLTLVDPNGLDDCDPTSTQGGYEGTADCFSGYDPSYISDPFYGDMVYPTHFPSSSSSDSPFPPLKGNGVASAWGPQCDYTCLSTYWLFEAFQKPAPPYMVAVAPMMTGTGNGVWHRYTLQQKHDYLCQQAAAADPVVGGLSGLTGAVGTAIGGIAKSMGRRFPKLQQQFLRLLPGST